MSAQTPTDYFRYCPGEQHIKLSNAVCRGRRRSNFPKCKGCQFNDDEKAQQGGTILASNSRLSPAVAQVGALAAQRGITAPAADNAPAPGGAEARQAPPDRGSTVAVRPDFGPARHDARNASFDDLFRETDIRGVVPDPLSPAVAWRIGHAAAQFLRSRLKGLARADPMARSLIVGHDARRVSAELHEPMCDGVRAAGVHVHDLGMVDTPQVYFAVKHTAAGGGIMTTGGRDRSLVSGFKFCGAGCRDVSTTTGLADIRDIARRVPQHKTGTMAPRHDCDVTESYRAYIWGLVGGASLARPIRLVVDAGGGVAERWAPVIFDGIAGLNISLVDAESRRKGGAAAKAERKLAALGESVVQSEADLGVWFDGDADACAFVDERGAFVDPDAAHALIARQVLRRRGGGVIVCDDGCGPTLSREVARCGGTLRVERGGSNVIKKSMAEDNAPLGLSRSGQVFFRENAGCESAFITLAVVLSIIAAGDEQMGALAANLA